MVCLFDNRNIISNILNDVSLELDNALLIISGHATNIGLIFDTFLHSNLCSVFTKLLAMLR